MTYYLLLLICLISLFSIKVQKSIMTFNQRTIRLVRKLKICLNNIAKYKNEELESSLYRPILICI